MKRSLKGKADLGWNLPALRHAPVVEQVRELTDPVALEQHEIAGQHLNLQTWA